MSSRTASVATVSAAQVSKSPDPPKTKPPPSAPGSNRISSSPPLPPELDSPELVPDVSSLLLEQATNAQVAVAATTSAANEWLKRTSRNLSREHTLPASAMSVSSHRVETASRFLIGPHDAHSE